MGIANSSQQQAVSSQQPRLARKRRAASQEMTEEARKLLEDNELGDLIEPLRAEGYTTIRKLAALREEEFPVRTSDKQNFRDMVGEAKQMVAEAKQLVGEAKIEAKLQERNLQRFSEDLKMRYSVRSLEKLAVFDVNILRTERPGYDPINEDEVVLFKAMQTDVKELSARFSALRLEEATSYKPSTYQLFPGTKTVILEPSNFVVQVEALNNYIRVGKEMRIPGSRSAVVVEEIENALDGKQRNGIGDIRDVSSATFYALLAPSLSGKTQLAFALRKCRPLYFAFGQGDADDTQWIYQCFSPLNRALSNFSNWDLESCGIVIRREQPLDRITRRALSANHTDRPLLVLGLLRALIVDGMGFTDDTNEGWMEYYLRPRNLVVEPISIRDFTYDSTVKQALKKYIFFVDEFAADTSRSIPCAFIRSLAKCVGIRFVCAGTNTRISNLVGLESASASGVCEDHLWCVVLPHMPPLCDKDSAQSSFRGEDLLSDYLQYQIEVSRGGIGTVIFNTLHVVEETGGDSVDAFLHVVDNVKDTIVSRKGGMVRLESNQALVSMCLSNFYDSVPPYREEVVSSTGKGQLLPPLSQTHAYLNYHYFKLRIPQDCASDRFIPTYVTEHGSIIYGASPSKMFWALSALNSIKKRTKKWVMQSSFDQNEEILQIACFLVKIRGEAGRSDYDRPIRNVVNVEEALPDVRPLSSVQPPNPLAPKLDGLALENMAHYAIVDSSHRGQEPHPFRGIGLLPFLERVVANFETSDTLSVNRLENSTDPRHEGSLGRLIELTQGLVVPFLNAADLKWSEGLMRFADSCRGNLNFGHYNRHPDRDKIDGSFELLNTSESADWYRFATMECKNWKDSVNAWDYVGILQKGLAIVQDRLGPGYEQGTQILPPKSDKKLLTQLLGQPGKKPGANTVLQVGIKPCTQAPSQLDNEQGTPTPSEPDTRTLLHISFVKNLAKFHESSMSQDEAQKSKWCAFGIRKVRIDDSWTPVVETLFPPPRYPERPKVVGIVIVTD